MVFWEKKYRRLYITCDYISAVLSWLLLFYYRKIVIEKSEFTFNKTLFLGIVLIPLFWILLYWIIGFYDIILKKYRYKVITDTVIQVLIGGILIFFIFIINDFVDTHFDLYKIFFILLITQFTITIFFRYIITKSIVKNIINNNIWFNTMIIGGDEKAKEIYSKLINKKNYSGNKFLGYLKSNCNDDAISEYLPKLGDLANITSIIEQNNISEIIIALETTEHHKIENILNEIQGYNIEVKSLPDIYDIISNDVKTSSVYGEPYIVYRNSLMQLWQLRIKRAFDIIFSSIFIIISLPFTLLIASLIKLDSKGPIFYIQKRVGKNSKEFNIYKFRTMIQNAENGTPLLSSDYDCRITKIGKFLRKTRIDEIPQFYNVLINDMSIVGPRPERYYFVNKIIEVAPHYKHLLRLKPGITSWGQVKYGYAENLEQMVERLKYDLIYVKNQSLFLDFRIIIFTILTIIRKEGK